MSIVETRVLRYECHQTDWTYEFTIERGDQDGSINVHVCHGPTGKQSRTVERSHPAASIDAAREELDELERSLITQGYEYAGAIKPAAPATPLRAPAHRVSTATGASMAPVLL